MRWNCEICVLCFAFSIALNMWNTWNSTKNSIESHIYMRFPSLLFNREMTLLRFLFRVCVSRMPLLLIMRSHAKWRGRERTKVKIHIYLSIRLRDFLLLNGEYIVSMYIFSFDKRRTHLVVEYIVWHLSLFRNPPTIDRFLDGFRSFFVRQLFFSLRCHFYIHTQPFGSDTTIRTAKHTHSGRFFSFSRASTAHLGWTRVRCVFDLHNTEETYVCVAVAVSNIDIFINLTIEHHPKMASKWLLLCKCDTMKVYIIARHSLSLSVCVYLLLCIDSSQDL